MASAHIEIKLPNWRILLFYKASLMRGAVAQFSKAPCPGYDQSGNSLDCMIALSNARINPDLILMHQSDIKMLAQKA